MTSSVAGTWEGLASGAIVAVAAVDDAGCQIYKGACVNLMYGPYQMPPEEKPKTVIKLICSKVYR